MRRRDGHKLERAAVETGPFRLSRGSMSAMVLVIMRVGASAVLMSDPRVRDICQSHYVFTLIIIARTMSHSRPSRLEGQHGQQDKQDQSSHGAEL